MPSSHNPADPFPPRTLYLYLHRPSREVQVLEVLDEQVRLRELLTVGDDLIFLDEEPDPVDADRTLAALLTGRGRHRRRHDVHRHPCRSVDVHVGHGTDTRQLQVAPSSRVGTVRRLAVDAFALPAAGRYTLRSAGATDELPDTAYVSDLPASRRCRLAFELVEG
jgi:hypothetical protein